MVGAADWCVFTVPAPLPGLAQELAEPLQLAADPCLRYCLGFATGQLPRGALPPLPGSAHSRGSNPPGPTSLVGLKCLLRPRPRSHGGR